MLLSPFDDIGYKLDFLAEFINLSEKRKNFFIRHFCKENKHVIKDFEIIFRIHRFNVATRHYSIIDPAFCMLHRIHSGTLQYIIRSCYKEEVNLPAYDLNVDEQAYHIVHNQLGKYYQQIKFEYSNYYFTNEALFLPVFCFFWNLADLIYNNYDFLAREVKRLSEKNKHLKPAETKILITELIEKILIGNFVSPNDIMLIKSDFEGFQTLVKFRKFISLEQASLSEKNKN